MTPEQLAGGFRRELLDKDSQAAGRLVQAYGVSWQRIKRDLDVLLSQIAVARKNGIPITKSWLEKEGRLRLLLDQIAIQIKQFEDVADFTILNGQSQAVRDAIRHAEALTFASVSPDKLAQVAITWNRIPAEALSHLVGFLGDGTPLRKALASLTSESLKKVSDGLYAGVAAGLNPRQIASTIRNGLGGDLTRALAISRTETLRAYRSAARENYQANKDVVNAWIWHSALGTRTCPVCWAMHGTIHPLEEEFASHVNCRCSQIPVVDPTLGIVQKPIKTGSELFEKLNEDQKRAILGKTRYELYKAGKLNLSEVVDYQVDKDWGASRTLKPIRMFESKSIPGVNASERLDFVNGHAQHQAVLANYTKLIETVHSTKPLPKIPIEFYDAPAYEGGRSAINMPYIGINLNSPMPEFSYIHEFGHTVEFHGINNAATTTAKGREFATWRAAIRKSKAFKRLRQLKKQNTFEVQLPDGRTIVENVDQGYVDYLLEWEELWARSYTQYIIAETQHPSLLFDLNFLRNESLDGLMYMKQWSDDDFEAILRAIRGIFNKRQWKPGS